MKLDGSLVIFIGQVTIHKIYLPLWDPSSQRHCGTCMRRAAAYVPGCRKSVGIFGRVTPCWSATAGFSEAADIARCEMGWLTGWVCFAHSKAPNYRKHIAEYTELPKHVVIADIKNYFASQHPYSSEYLCTIKVARLFSSVIKRSSISAWILSVAVSSVSSFSVSLLSSSFGNSSSRMASISLSVLSSSSCSSSSSA